MAHATFPSHSRKFSDSSPSPPRSEVSSGPSSSVFESFFFPSDSELDVRRDIALLSYLLSHTKVEGQRSGGKLRLSTLWILGFTWHLSSTPGKHPTTKLVTRTSRPLAELIAKRSLRHWCPLTLFLDISRRTHHQLKLKSRRWSRGDSRMDRPS